MVYTGILLVAAGRGVEIGRALVSPVFRNRAYWTSVVLILLGFTSILNITQLFGSAPSNPVLAELETLPWIVEFFVLFAFIDSTILVATQLDFFHRDALHWSRIHRPVLAAYLVSDVAGFTAAIYASSGSPPFWQAAIFYVGIAVVLGLLALSVPLLLVGARRTTDRYMRRFVTFLGIVLAFYLVGMQVQLFITSPLVLDLLSLVAPYLLYRTVMSLSPVGRVSAAEAAAEFQPGLTKITPI